MTTPPASITGLIERQARATPDRLAVVSGDESLTYADLDARAERLAGLLRTRHGVGAGDAVGVAIPRSTDALVALLAVLQAGGAYLPITAGTPAKRPLHQARASGAGLV